MNQTEGLDPIIHAPKRLAAMALLDASVSTDFSFLKAHLAVSDSDLSKQMAALRDAGYVTIHKSGHGRSGHTTYRITRAGRSAYRRHREQLLQLLAEPDAGSATQHPGTRAPHADAGS